MPSMTPISGNPFAALMGAVNNSSSDVWRWGNVVEADPPRVHLDGDTAPMVASIESVTPVSVGDRVRVHLYNRRATIMGVLHRGEESQSATSSLPLQVTSSGKASVTVKEPITVYRQHDRIWLDGALVAGTTMKVDGYVNTGISLTVLPVWARPTTVQRFAIFVAGAIGALVIQPSGVCEIWAYGSMIVNQSVTLAGLSWLAPDIALTLTEPTTPPRSVE